MLCSKVNKKVSAFARLDNYIPREQIFTVCNAVILSNFKYCLLIWLFCNKHANKEIDHTHNHALRILYRDYESSFETLLASSCSNSIQIKNLQKLMTEVYKSKNHLNPSIVWEFHEKKHITFKLRMQNIWLWTQFSHFEVVSYGTFLMSVSNKYPHCRVLKRGSKTGQRIDAPVNRAWISI